MQPLLGQDVPLILVLKLKAHLAPIKAAIIPLKKNDEKLVNLAKNIKSSLQELALGRVVLENTGNIGKSYRKHDEIGTNFIMFSITFSNVSSIF